MEIPHVRINPSSYFSRYASSDPPISLSVTLTNSPLSITSPMPSPRAELRYYRLKDTARNIATRELLVHSLLWLHRELALGSKASRGKQV